MKIAIVACRISIAHVLSSIGRHGLVFERLLSRRCSFITTTTRQRRRPDQKLRLERICQVISELPSDGHSCGRAFTPLHANVRAPAVPNADHPETLPACFRSVLRRPCAPATGSRPVYPVLKHSERSERCL